MRLAVFWGLLIAMCAVPARAQYAPRIELAGGYSYLRADVDTNEPFAAQLEGVHGARASLALGLARYIALAADYSFYTKSFQVGPLGVEVRLHQILGGFQLGRPAGGGARVRPFAHLLVGVARRSDEFELLGGTDTRDQNVLAGAVGAGLDVALTRRIDLRVLQFDYNPTRFASEAQPDVKETQHNFRIGIGLVIH